MRSIHFAQKNLENVSYLMESVNSIPENVAFGNRTIDHRSYAFHWLALPFEGSPIAYSLVPIAS